ncbi:ABC transporter permease [Sneathiella sp. CAU 1612]|uniref:ABC transporter permease n=1 Tax=Sneathiella sedimenti TaxID=2816034 RepID=A0ABS3F4Y8_9PROT|nr:ABC transporter permease [Sneathiella sedimenti]MBO0333191.1 ABC transporter permease [Sneathiella sedimenti]
MRSPFTSLLSSKYGIIVLLGLTVLFAFIFVPEFGTVNNLTNIAIQSAPLAILAIGQTVVIIAGLIDLSVGMLLGLIVVIIADLMQGESSMTVVAILAALGLGGGVGMINGLLNNLLRIHPLILTFGMLSILQGLIFVYTDRSVGQVSSEFSWMANGTVIGVPFAIILLMFVALLTSFLLYKTRLGAHIFAVGGGEEQARRAGIMTGRVKIWAFIISGVSAGVAGMLVAGRLGTGYPNAGVGYELDAIVAVVLGGTSLAGGRGSILGTIAAVFVLGVASNILNLMEISSFVQIFVKGLIVVIAILLNQPKRIIAS